MKDLFFRIREAYSEWKFFKKHPYCEECLKINVHRKATRKYVIYKDLSPHALCDAHYAGKMRKTFRYSLCEENGHETLDD